MTRTTKNTALLLLCSAAYYPIIVVEALDKPRALAATSLGMNDDDRNLQFIVGNCPATLDQCKSRVPESFSLNNWSNFFGNAANDPNSPFQQVAELVEILATLDYTGLAQEAEQMDLADIAQLVADVQEAEGTFVKDDKEKKDNGDDEEKEKKKEDDEGEKKKDDEGEKKKEQGNEGEKKKEQGDEGEKKKVDDEVEKKKEDNVEVEKKKEDKEEEDVVAGGDKDKDGGEAKEKKEEEMTTLGVDQGTSVEVFFNITGTGTEVARTEDAGVNRIARLFEELGLFFNTLYSFFSQVIGLLTSGLGGIGDLKIMVIGMIKNLTRTILHQRLSIDPECQVDLLVCEFNEFAFEVIPDFVKGTFISAGTTDGTSISGAAESTTTEAESTTTEAESTTTEAESTTTP